MIVIFLRSIFLYIIVLIVMRLMGKREIGQLQPFELAISIMIADLATTPMADSGIPISNRHYSNTWIISNAFSNINIKYKKYKST